MKRDPALNAAILVVDDDAMVLQKVAKILALEGFEHVRTIADGALAREAFREFQPDLLILDLVMPRVDGFKVMAQIKEEVGDEEAPPNIALTSIDDPVIREKALAMGATEVLEKPVDEKALVAVVKSTATIHLMKRRFNMEKDNLIEERDRARLEAARRLAIAAEFKGTESRAHIVRVGFLAGRIAERLGLDRPSIDVLREAAPLHDIGMVGIPDSIILKSGTLTPHEDSLMRSHTTIGANILQGSRISLLKTAEEIALCHHERWDGTGYPAELKRRDIPISARITAVADSFDVMTHDRPHRAAWPTQQALAEIDRLAGSQYDPRVVEAFLSLIDDRVLVNEMRNLDVDGWGPAVVRAAVEPPSQRPFASVGSTLRSLFRVK